MTYRCLDFRYFDSGVEKDINTRIGDKKCCYGYHYNKHWEYKGFIIRFKIEYTDDAELYFGLRAYKNTEIHLDYLVSDFTLDIWEDLINKIDSDKVWRYKEYGWLCWKYPVINFNFYELKGESVKSLIEDGKNSQYLTELVKEIKDFINTIKL